MVGLAARGNSQRVNRNMLVFLAPDAKRVADLEAAARDYLAWNDICNRVRELDLAPMQAGQAQDRRRQADEAARLRINDTYIWALVPTQPDPARPVEWEPLRTEGSGDLGVRTSAKLRQADLLRTQHAPQNIRLDLNGPLAAAWTLGHVSVGELWSYYCRHPYLPRLRDRRVLDEGVRDVLSLLTWDIEGFALASGYDEAASRYEGLAIPHADPFGQIVDTTLLVQPGRALAQREAEETPARERAGDTATGDQVGAAPPPGAGSEPASGAAAGVTAPPPVAPDSPARNRRFFGVYKVDPERYARDLTRLAQEILPHLIPSGDGTLDVTVEIAASNPDGFGEDKVRILNENAETLKFDQHGFEDR